MRLARAPYMFGAVAVAGIAAWASWSHMVHVALRFGESPEVAHVLPLSVDGLLVVAAAAMTDDKRDSRTPRLSARVAFGAGVAASLAANIAAAQPTVGARIVAAWPALALLLMVELLSRSGRRRTPAQTPNPVRTPAHTEVQRDEGQTPAGPAAAQAGAASAGAPRARVQRTGSAGKPVAARRTPTDDETLALIREAYPDRTPSLNEVQRTLGCGRSKADRLRKLLDEQTPEPDPVRLHVA